MRLFLTLILVTQTSVFLFAQQDSTSLRTSLDNNLKKNEVALILKIDILNPVVSIVKSQTDAGVYAELGFKRRQSFQLSNYLHFYTSPAIHENRMDLYMDYKFFLSRKQAYSGIYIGPYLAISSLSYEREVNGDFPPYYRHVKFEQQALGGGLLAGYQFIIKRRFVIDLLGRIGAAQPVATKLIALVNEPPVNSSLRLTWLAAINLGYKF